MSYVDELVDQVSGEMYVGAEQAAANRMARTRPEVGKRAPLGFGTYSLAAAASVVLTARPQRPFHPDRLLVTSSQLGVTISSIKVGDEEQILGGSVPAELYGTAALADPKNDDFTPSTAGIDFTITITNNAASLSTGAVGMKGFVKR